MTLRIHLLPLCHSPSPALLHPLPHAGQSGSQALRLPRPLRIKQLRDNIEAQQVIAKPPPDICHEKDAFHSGTSDVRQQDEATGGAQRSGGERSRWAQQPINEPPAAARSTRCERLRLQPPKCRTGSMRKRRRSMYECVCWSQGGRYRDGQCQATRPLQRGPFRVTTCASNCCRRSQLHSAPVFPR